MKLSWKIIRKPGYIGYVLYEGEKKIGLVDRRGFGRYVGYVLSPDEEVEQGIMKMVVGSEERRICQERLIEYVKSNKTNNRSGIS